MQTNNRYVALALLPVFSLAWIGCSEASGLLLAVSNGAQTDECDDDCRVELGGPVEISATATAADIVIQSVDASPHPAEFDVVELPLAVSSTETLLATANGDGQTEVTISSEGGAAITVRLNLITE